MKPHHPYQKRTARARINADIERFRQKGGKVRQFGMGESGDKRKFGYNRTQSL